MTTRTTPTDAVATITGIVAAQPQVQLRPLGPRGREVPVLCLLLQAEGACPAPIRVEQPFHAGAYEQCQAAARRFRPGLHVTVQAPLAALRLTVAGPAGIHITTTHPAPARAPRHA